MFAGVPSAERIGRRTPLVIFLGISSSLGGWEKWMEKGTRFKKVGPTKKNVHPSQRGLASIIMEGTFAFKKWQLYLKGSCR